MWRYKVFKKKVYNLRKERREKKKGTRKFGTNRLVEMRVPNPHILQSSTFTEITGSTGTGSNFDVRVMRFSAISVMFMSTVRKKMCSILKSFFFCTIIRNFNYFICYLL